MQRLVQMAQMAVTEMQVQVVGMEQGETQRFLFFVGMIRPELGVVAVLPVQEEQMRLLLVVVQGMVVPEGVAELVATMMAVMVHVIIPLRNRVLLDRHLRQLAQPLVVRRVQKELVITIMAQRLMGAQEGMAHTVLPVPMEQR